MAFTRESGNSLRQRYLAVCAENPKHGPRLFAETFVHKLGLTDKAGRTLVSESTGGPTVSADRSLTSNSVTMLDLTEAILGPEWPKVLGINTPGNELPPQSYYEGDGAGIGPGNLPNISAWKVAVTGLLGARALEMYDSPEFTISKLAQVENVQPGTPPNFRLHDVIKTGLPAPEIDPNIGHRASKLESIWLQTYAMKLKGESVTVNKLGAFHDITGGRVLQRAGEMGWSVGLAEELDAIYALTGQDATWNLGYTNDATPTSYVTYNTVAGTTPVINDMVQPLVDFESLAGPRNLFNQMYHPVNTALPINVMPTVAIVPPQLKPAMDFALSPKVQQRNAPSGTTKTNLSSYEINNPYAGLVTQVVESRWLDTVHRAATGTTGGITGLGLTGSGLNRWYIGEPGKFFRKLSAWPLQTYTFGEANSPYTANHLIEFASFANSYYKFQVCSAFHMVRCLGA